jgi:antitoxin MazE
MKVVVSRWGNSLGVRVPKELATRAGLTEGVAIEMSLEGDRIIMSAARPHYALADLLKDVTPDAMHEAFDWGPDKGRERVR